MNHGNWLIRVVAPSEGIYVKYVVPTMIASSSLSLRESIRFVEYVHVPRAPRITDNPTILEEIPTPITRTM